LAGETKKTKKTLAKPQKPMIWEKILVSSSSGPGSPNLLPDHWFFWFRFVFFVFFWFRQPKSIDLLT